MVCTKTHSENVSDPSYELVTDPASLEAMARTLTGNPGIAIDVEGDSLYHYFPKVCLLQISTTAETYLIDPLALQDLSALGPVMASPETEKVFHAAIYDVHSLRRDFGFSFSHIFDTHMAAQLLGYEQLGLTALMARILGVEHSKLRQRDDWSRRPLNQEQLEYAAMDTRHLLALRDALESHLREAGRLDWAKEEFVVAAASEQREKEFDPEGFRRIKGSRKLSRPQRRVLQSIFLLRDQYARAMDLPPFRVMHNSVLLDLARTPPTSQASLSQRKGISHRVASKFAGELYDTIRRTQSEPVTAPRSLPHTNLRAPSLEVASRLEKLKAWRLSKSKDLSLPVGVVCPGGLLDAIAGSAPVDIEALARIKGMRQWRVREFGSELLEVVHQD